MADQGTLDHDAIVGEQVRKFFELRTQYGLYATDGHRIGSIEQVEQSPLHFLTRLFSGLDVALPTTLAVEDSQGRPILACTSHGSGGASRSVALTGPSLAPSPSSCVSARRGSC